MNIGTIQRIGDLTMRYGLRSQFAPLDCTSSRRNTVMCALRRATGVTTGYERDSSSKRPMLSVALATRSPRDPVARTKPCWLRAPPFPSGLAIDNRSFHMRLGHQGSPALPVRSTERATNGQRRSPFETSCNL